MFTWSYEQRVPTTASAERIWQLWSQPETWSAWDHDIEWARLEGPFSEGARGTMKPKGGPVVPFTLLTVEPGRSFSDSSQLPLTRVDFLHRVAEGVIVHRIEMRGWLTPLFRRLIGAKIQRGLRPAMARLASLAEAPGADPNG